MDHTVSVTTQLQHRVPHLTLLVPIPAMWQTAKNVALLDCWLFMNPHLLLRYFVSETFSNSVMMKIYSTFD